MAVDKTEKETAKEEVNLLLADINSKYYEEKYNDKKNVGELDSYIKKEIGDGKTTQGGYEVKIANNEEIEIWKNGALILSGILADGKVKGWNDENLVDTTPPQDFTPTIVNITAQGFTIQANAMDNESGINKYEYWINGVKYESREPDYKIDTLEAGTSYEIYVIAYDRAGNSKKSEIINAKTKVRARNIWNLGEENSDIETYQGNPEYKGASEGVHLYNSVLASKENYILNDTFTIIIETKNIEQKGCGFMVATGMRW